MNNSDTILEICKVQRRVPRWLNNESQINSTILISFLELTEKDSNIAVERLKGRCKQISTFYENYNQMKNFGEKNHGKVFEEVEGVVHLWKPVKDFILTEYNKRKQN